jgi:hypothetical protein
MTDLVECYSGYTYPERPKAFHWQGERLEITQILRSWQAPCGICFLALTTGDQTFELCYDESSLLWSLRLIS